MEGALLRNRVSGSIYARPFAVLNLVTEQVVKSLLARVNSTKDEDGRVHDDSGVSIAWLRPYALQSPDLKPELRWEAVLVDIIHRVVAIPPTDNEHRVVTDDGSMAESIQWLCSRSLDHLPLELFVFKRAPPEVIIANTSVISRENVD